MKCGIHYRSRSFLYSVTHAIIMNFRIWIASPAVCRLAMKCMANERGSASSVIDFRRTKTTTVGHKNLISPSKSASLKTIAKHCARCLHKGNPAKPRDKQKEQKIKLCDEQRIFRQIWEKLSEIAWKPQRDKKRKIKRWIGRKQILWRQKGLWCDERPLWVNRLKVVSNRCRCHTAFVLTDLSFVAVLQIFQPDSIFSTKKLQCKRIAWKMNLKRSQCLGNSCSKA